MSQPSAQVKVIADTENFDVALQSLNDTTREFGRLFTSTMHNAIKSGQGFDNFLKSLGKRFSDLALKRALDPLDNLIDGFLKPLTSVLAGEGAKRFTKEGVFSGGNTVPFARGGIVSTPHFFGLGNGMGLMGEAGPEAILPLKRDHGGRLGVATTGNAARPVNVVFNVQANDVESFHRSEGQISTLLARIVRSGSKNL